MQPTEVAQMELRDLRFRVWRLSFSLKALSRLQAGTAYASLRVGVLGFGFRDLRCQGSDPHEEHQMY